ncbi:MAG: transposase [Candidatus Hydrogenedentes bacterium]|nr:transposase [Candidatus Hydrogenedentota bacterium]
MARIARVVVPGYPHHVTQRGNRRQPTFFCEDDYAAYIELMSQWCTRQGVQVWAYCLMPNHVHLVCVPESQDALRLAIGKAHLRYTRRVNLRERWRGHLWQGRFASFVMDERHLLAAARYIERNPVRAELAEKPWEYRWSSAAAHMAGRDDGLAKVGPLLEMVGDWEGFLTEQVAEQEAHALRMHERTGRPLGDDGFIAGLERLLGREIRKKKKAR